MDEFGLKSGITQENIDPSKILKSVKDKSAGGIVLFLGTIRDRTDGAEVMGLQYEVYRRMAERRIGELEKEVRERWPIKAISLVHREGKLKPGEVSVAVAVSAEHRGEAFEAARFAIERIKRSFPIWKRETFARGRKAWAKGAPIESRARTRKDLRSGRRGNGHQRRKNLVKA